MSQGFKNGPRTDLLSKEEKIAAIDKIHKMIRDGTLGEDYTIANRDKNRQLRQDYCIDDNKVKGILLGLQYSDLIKVTCQGKCKFDIVNATEK